MSDVTGAGAAQGYREHMRAKAERLGEGEDARNVDASSFEPAEKLYAGVKTGMRPVSRQARKRGGSVVHGEQTPLGAHALARPGRRARKAGGELEAEIGKGYINRNQKAADEQREGHYPNGGMKRGGRTHKAGGGLSGLGMLGGILPIALSELSGNDNSGEGSSSAPYSPHPPGQGSRATGGRVGRAGGGYLPREEAKGASDLRTLKRKTASSDVEKTDGRPAAEDGRLGRASGGRVGRQAGGPLATPISEGMGGQGRMNFNYGPQTSTASKLGLRDGGRAKAHERYGKGPGPGEHHPGMASGGRAARAHGGRASFGPGEFKSAGDGGVKPSAAAAEGKPVTGPELVKKRTPRGEESNRAKDLNPHKLSRQRRLMSALNYADGGAIGQPSARHPAPKGGSRSHVAAEARERADGGEVAKKALAAHHAEHNAMAKGRARGGKADGGEADDQFGPSKNWTGPISGKHTLISTKSDGTRRVISDRLDKGYAEHVANRNNSMAARDEARIRKYQHNPAPLYSKYSVEGPPTAEEAAESKKRAAMGYQEIPPEKGQRGAEARGGKVRRGGHPEGCTCGRCTASKAKGGLLSKWTAEQKAAGGRVGRAKGGKAKGMNVNIVIAPGGQNAQPAPPPGGGPLAPLRAPVPPQLPPPGMGAGPPGAGPPAMMPPGAPGAGGMPPGMPMPMRARGGRAPKIHGEPMAGSGSGIGRLQKTRAYGHRSREGAGMRR